MIRVLHVTIGMNRGGIETFIMNVYRKIDRSKIQFDFLVHTDKECAYDEEIKELGGKIFSVPARNKGVIKNRRALNNFFKNHPEYKIVHQHVSSLTYVTPLKTAKKYGVPTRIIHAHSTGQGGSKLHYYIHKYNQYLVKSFATHFYACSEMAAKWLYPKKQTQNNEFEKINNAIDIEKYIFNEKIRKLKRDELGIEDEYVIGHIGRFNYVKNHDFIIDIFKSVHSKNTKVKLLLIGDGRLREEIEDKVKRVGLKNNVIFTGIRSDVHELLQAMDSFVFPSLYEGLGIVAVEAQAAGLPCVMSDVIPKEVAITRNTKYLSLDESSDVWADVLLTYTHDFVREDTGKEIITNGYDINNLVIKLENFYQNNIQK